MRWYFFLLLLIFLPQSLAFVDDEIKYQVEVIMGNVTINNQLAAKGQVFIRSELKVHDHNSYVIAIRLFDSRRFIFPHFNANGFNNWTARYELRVDSLSKWYILKSDTIRLKNKIFKE